MSIENLGATIKILSFHLVDEKKNNEANINEPTTF